MNQSQNSLFKADTYVRSVAEAEFWDWFMGMDDTIIDRIAFGGVKELEELYQEG